MSARDDTPLTAGELIVANVAAHGIDTVFGIPGAQTYPLFDGFHRFGLRVIVPRHEQAAGYMAMGAAKSTGRPAVFSVVPGPGVLNAAAALCTAQGNCSPVVCLTADVPSAYQGRGRGHLHELKDQLSTLNSIIKNASELSVIEDVSLGVARAFQSACSNRPGPVSVQMCWDTLAQPGPPGAAAVSPLPLHRPEIDLDRIDAAAMLIAAARNPMIMCGAGAQDASEAVRELARTLDAPVTAFRSGRGVVPDDDPLAAPPVAARLLWDDVDLLIGVGSRLEMPYVRWRSPMIYEARPAGPKLVRIDIDAAQMERLVPDVGIVGDAAEACAALSRALAARKRRGRRGRADVLAAAKLQAQRLIARIQPQAEYLRVIRETVPRDGFIVPELSQVGFTTYTGALPILEPRSYVTEGHQGTLGFGFPTALGVKVANPDRAVVSLTGDGGFMFGVQELATAAEHDIAVVVLLFNNGAYANVLRDQQQTSGRVIGSRFENPDFVRLAEAFDVAATRIDSPAALQPALERAVAADCPWLIEIQVPAGSETSPWPLIHMQRPPT